MRIIRHLVLGFVSAVLLLGASAAAVLAFPQPLFAYRAERGALQLWSDRPFDAAKADAVLADTERRMRARRSRLGRARIEFSLPMRNGAAGSCSCGTMARPA